MRWRLLLSPPAEGAWNMALDEALMDHARSTGHTVLRVYSWSVPTLSLGRNQTARGAYAPDRLRERGIAVVRRPTGGRAILHQREITYSVTAPVDSLGALRESYNRINRLLRAGLSTLGVEAHVALPASASPAGAPGLTPCFDHPSAGELVHAGRKLVGSAQWRHSGALLQHGSILVDNDQQVLPSLLLEPAAAGSPGRAPRAATLRAALGRAPDPAEAAEALFHAVRQLEDSGAVPFDPDPALLARADELRRRYLDDGWTWRR